MKKFFLLCIFCVLTRETAGQVNTISVSWHGLAFRKYNTEMNRFWGIGFNVLTDVELRISNVGHTTISSGRSSETQASPPSVFLIRGKQKYDSEKWDMWLVTSLSAYPYYVPLWQKNDRDEASLRYAIYLQFSPLLELNYRLNERVYFLAQIDILRINIGATYEYEQTRNSYSPTVTKEWKYGIHMRVGQRSFTLSQIGLIYRLK